ncbi:antitermination protein [Escherichia coli]|uniref:antitermination protein Q n=1 Tax=Escherichia coli TaxID=562 RepID=UPI001F477D13|nr:antitermination protein [Escherichia coli]
MNLESILKFHFPKSPRLSDESRGTSPDALNTTDALTAAGMAQSRVTLGYGAFLGKMELSQAEKNKAVSLLIDRLKSMAKDYEYVMELNDDHRNGLIILVAVFAFRDYCQSAATEKVCPKCDGHGHLLMPYCKYTSTICARCGGKGYVKNHCQRCKGRGEVPDKTASEAAEMPVFKTCQHCGGRGYSRFPVDLVRRAVNQLVFPVSRSTWWKKYRVFYEDAIAALFKEEARAESEIKRVTRGE